MTFGALQLLLAGLLIGTYSVHFAALSVLCGGLWYSINWFAHEISQAQEKEAEAERLRKKKRGETKAVVEDSADDEGEDTEVEGGLKESTTSLGYQDNVMKEEIAEAMSATTVRQQDGLSSGAQATAGSSNTRQRRTEDPQSSASELSTDSEWEKVDSSR